MYTVDDAKRWCETANIAGVLALLRYLWGDEFLRRRPDVQECSIAAFWLSKHIPMVSDPGLLGRVHGAGSMVRGPWEEAVRLANLALAGKLDIESEFQSVLRERSELN